MTAHEATFRNYAAKLGLTVEFYGAKLAFGIEYFSARLCKIDKHKFRIVKEVANIRQDKDIEELFNELYK